MREDLNQGKWLHRKSDDDVGLSSVFILMFMLHAPAEGLVRASEPIQVEVDLKVSTSIIVKETCISSTCLIL